MKLYHGTTSEFDEIDLWTWFLLICRIGTGQRLCPNTRSFVRRFTRNSEL